MSSFAESRRKELARKVEASVKSSSPWYGIEAIGYSDSSRTEIFTSSGGSTEGSKVFIAQGVKRVVEVTLPNFEDRSNFVTFRQPFIDLLKEYKIGGYTEDKARDIYAKYGMFVLERVLYGGFQQTRVTMSQDDYNSLNSSESQAATCYGRAVKAEGKIMGFEFGTEYARDECDDAKRNNMISIMKNTSNEFEEITVDGGKIVGDKFQVDAEDATLLIEPDKYPDGDKGIHIRPLHEFLDPEKVSFKDMVKYQLTAEDFGSFRLHLKAHMDLIMKQNWEALGRCSNQCDEMYIDSNPKECQCFNYLVAPIQSPAPSPQPPQAMNVALAGTASQSSTVEHFEASYAINGVINWRHAHTATQDDPWWMVQLEQVYKITEVVVYNRVDSCCQEYLKNFRMEISNGGEGAAYITAAPYDVVKKIYKFEIPDGVWGDRVKIYLQGQEKTLVMSEVIVKGIEEWYDEKHEEELVVRNIATRGVASYSQNTSGLGNDPNNAIDGSVDGLFTMTDYQRHPWWQVTFNQEWKLFKVYVNVGSGIIVDSKDQMDSFDLTIFLRGEAVWHKKINDGGDCKESYLVDVEGTVGDMVRISRYWQQKQKVLVLLSEVEIWGRHEIESEI